MMQLGTQTGSLMNHLMSRSAPKEPEAGMPATLLMWTDRHPATVIDVFTKGKTAYFTVQEDHWKALKPMNTDDQAYEYTRNPEGATRTFRMARKGGWEQVTQNPETGRYIKIGNGGILLGRREKFEDPSF